jgi:hypothetical protein
LEECFVFVDREGVAFSFPNSAVYFLGLHLDSGEAFPVAVQPPHAVVVVAAFPPPFAWHQVVVASCTAFHIDQREAEGHNEAFVVWDAAHKDLAALAGTALAFAPFVAGSSLRVVVVAAAFAALLALPKVFVVAHKAIAEQESAAAVVGVKHGREIAVAVRFRE